MEINQAFRDENPVNNPHVDAQQILSLKKFLILTFSSFGLYGVWWMYKVWQFFKQKEHSDTLPVARAIFSIVFFYPLCEKIKDFALENGVPAKYSSGVLFAGYFILNMLGRLPDPYWLVYLLSLICLVPPFSAYNAALENATEFEISAQKSFSGKQIAIIIIGVICWMLIILGLTAEL